MAVRPDPSRFEDLYRSHRGAVYGALLRELRNPEDAEDATQTAFLQAFGAYERGSRPERPRAWLLTIAENLRRRRFRSDRRAAEVPLDEALVAAPARDGRVEDLREALDALPLNQRAALVLREVAGLSYAEIARHLSLSVNAVQMLLFRARRSLREQLATSSRGAGALVPGWLVNLITKAERLAPLRVGGVAAVAAAAAIAVTGAESAAPPAVGERHPSTSPRVQATGPAAPDESVPRLTRRRQVTTKPGRRPEAAVVDAAPAVTDPGATAPAAGAQPVAPAPGAVPAVPLPLPEPELPKLAVPVPTPAPPPVPVPVMPPALPPLPPELPQAIEGALAPQLDGVLAGR